VLGDCVLRVVSMVVQTIGDTMLTLFVVVFIGWVLAATLGTITYFANEPKPQS
jgi:hypothetical protein